MHNRRITLRNVPTFYMELSEEAKPRVFEDDRFGAHFDFNVTLVYIMQTRAHHSNGRVVLSVGRTSPIQVGGFVGGGRRVGGVDFGKPSPKASW